MLHPVSLRYGVQTLILMQNPITKAREAKAKIVEIYKSLIQLQKFSLICNYMHSFLNTAMHAYCKELFSNFWSLVRLRAAELFASSV